jgi:hypothetical protein
VTPEQVKWLSDALERSDAKWKIPYAHHPIYSSGAKHGSELDLQVLVEPLYVKNGVDVVFAGHEHFYERIKPQKGIYYFTQGGGAKLREGNIRARSALTANGFETDNSFTLIEIVDDQMFFETISRRGQVVDSGSLLRREVTNSTQEPVRPRPATTRRRRAPRWHPRAPPAPGGCERHPPRPPRIRVPTRAAARSRSAGRSSTGRRRER